MGVFVVGMHRSGTSAMAAMLEACGLDVGTASGLRGADPANPSGYFELQEIGDVNDAVLAHLGGRWDCPPQLHDGWENDPAMLQYVQLARSTKAALLPKERWVLKDPRITLLLPLWRRAVLDRGAAVLIVRNPMEVAWSVTLRNGIPTMTALALWSAYNRAALHGLGGLPVYVCTYDDLVAAPGETMHAVVEALASWGELDAGAVDVERAASLVRPELRRNTWRRDSPDALDRPGEIDRLHKFLTELAGPHDVFEPVRQPSAPWEEALLSERRFGVENVRAASVDTVQLRSERDDLAAAVARLEAELTDATAAADASARHLRETSAALASANNRWERLERRLPVRTLRRLQRFGRSLGH